MPGVPSGRGCDGCRKQKKKCDQARPQCSRCKRLAIACTGSGERRFKFINSSGVDEGQSDHGSSLPSQAIPQPQTQTTQVFRWRHAPQQRHLALRMLRQHPHQLPAQVPASQAALIAGNLHSRLQITDIRFDPSCFGSFLDMIPQRIGQDCALDAAAEAFATAFNDIHAGLAQQSTKSLMKHGNALREIRTALAGKPEDLTVDFICAIYLTMVTESLLRGNSGRHFEGMSIILTSGMFRNWKSRFELEILTVICFTILMECIGNPNIDPSLWLEEVLDHLEPKCVIGPAQIDTGYLTLSLRFMARVVAALREPWNHYVDILNCYKDLVEDRRRIRLLLNKVNALAISAANTMDPNKTVRLLAVQLSVQTSMAFVLNGLLQQFHLDNASLYDTAQELADEMLELGRAALRFRPLGAMHVLPGLNVVWAIAEDEKRQEAARDMVLSMQGCGFSVANDMQSPSWWRKKFAHVKQVIARQNMVGNDSLSLEPIEFKYECHFQ